jgi:hypothetical protein
MTCLKVRPFKTPMKGAFFSSLLKPVRYDNNKEALTKRH